MSYYLKKNWKICTLVCILQICTWGLQAATALLLIQCFAVAMEFDLKGFLFWMSVNLGVWGLYFGLGMLEGYVQARAVRILNNHVRHDTYCSVLNTSYQGYHDKDAGEYLSWLTNHVKELENLAWDPFFDCVGRGAQVMWSILALARLHWSLLAASLLVSFLMWWMPKLFEEKLKRVGEEYVAAQALGTSKMKDLLRGLDIMRSFCGSGRFVQDGDHASDSVERHNFRRRYIQSNISGVLGYINVAAQFSTDILIVILAVQGRLPLATIGGGGSLAGGVTNGLDGLATCRLSFASAKPYFDKITVHAEDLPAQSAEGLSPVREAVAVENLTFRYGEKPVLHGMTFRFEKGGKYALTGPSGCGKSTLLKLLLGWLPDYEGTITFDGQNAKDYTPEQLQKQMSYIEQDVFLFNTTIRENITLGEDFTEEQMQKALQDSALAGDLAHMPLGLDTPVGEEGSALSGGQKQRVAIARALIHDRSILLVDEGTSALDQKNADIVEKSLLSNPDLTLILVSHHLTEERKAQFTQVFDLAA